MSRFQLHGACDLVEHCSKVSLSLSPGLGDMAVSNTIGSNVFDILVGLGVPWAIQTIAVSYGSEVMGPFSPPAQGGQA